MLRNKLSGKGTTIFSVMSNLADDQGAINLSQGFPDFEGPQALRDRVSYHLEHGHNPTGTLWTEHDIQLVRFCFAKNDDTLHEATKRLLNL